MCWRQGLSVLLQSQHFVTLSCFAPALQKSVQGSSESASGYTKLAFQLSAGGPAVGMAFALCLSAWLKLAGGNLFADLGMTLVAAYGSFHVADWAVPTSWQQSPWG